MATSSPGTSVPHDCSRYGTLGLLLLEHREVHHLIRFDSTICNNLNAALSREWLETNGLGGYASSTIVGLNTRRYHGLLVAALNPPLERYVLLSKLEETLTIDGRRYDLACNQYHDTFYPQGYQYLKSFRLDPFPIFTFKVEGIEVEKSVFMIQGENSTVIQYEIRSEAEHADAGARHSKVELEVRPLIAYRQYHTTTRENTTLYTQLNFEKEIVSVSPYYGLPVLHFTHDARDLDTKAYWFRNFEYQREQDRGLDLSEDLYSPMAFIYDLTHSKKANLIASVNRHEIKNVDLFRKAELKRREEVASIIAKEELISALTVAADQFIVKRGEEKSVIAGYHWFGDWGRDTMISLPGLTLATGRFDTARRILLTFARAADQGMIPSYFPENGEKPQYTSIDASFWMFEAVRSFVGYTKDYRFVKAHLYPVLCDIIAWHIRGTRFGIRVDKDSLITLGETGIPLTWMDAKISDWVITPRYGKPVEVQALWYNALRIMEDLSEIFGDNVGFEKYKNLAGRVYRHFNQTFWNGMGGYLYDVVNGASSDSSIRPNQIFAISLPYMIVSRQKAKSILEIVQQHLLTPFGLRTLSPKDPQYRKHYEGDPWSRDSAYHQGTVWAWLMGPFLTAYLKIHHHNPESIEQVKLWLKPFQEHLKESGLGQVSEIFDGDLPHTPRGCIAQAWSVAELLRVCSEEIHKSPAIKLRDSKIHLFEK